MLANRLYRNEESQRLQTSLLYHSSLLYSFLQRLLAATLSWEYPYERFPLPSLDLSTSK